MLEIFFVMTFWLSFGIGDCLSSAERTSVAFWFSEICYDVLFLTFVDWRGSNGSWAGLSAAQAFIMIVVIRVMTGLIVMIFIVIIMSVIIILSVIISIIMTGIIIVIISISEMPFSLLYLFRGNKPSHSKIDIQSGSIRSQFPSRPGQSVSTILWQLRVERAPSNC